MRKSLKATNIGPSQAMLAASVETTWTTAKVIAFTANRKMVIANMSVKAKEPLFLSRSEKFSDRCYVVRWNEERNCYQCSCGAGCKSHPHIENVKAYMIARFAHKSKKVVIDAAPVVTENVPQVEEEKKPQEITVWSKEAHLAGVREQKRIARERKAAYIAKLDRIREEDEAYVLDQMNRQNVG